MANSTNSIKFIIGDEFIPVIETAEQFKDSLFYDVYQKVFSSINDFVQNIDENKPTNNIFAIAGERGSGKTSCMQSIAQLLIGKSTNIGKAFTHVKQEFEYIPSKQYIAIDPIDPSMFEKDNNILQIFVGKLFKDFKNNIERKDISSNSSDYQAQKRELIAVFEEVYRNIKVLFKKSQSSNESLDALLDLSASYDLQNNIKKLVSKYLEFNHSNILVLQIDDIDLQTKYAYDMVEQIRKYLMQPNIITLMAVRIPQLDDVIKKQYIEEFGALIDQHLIDIESISEMSDRYLGKLIPHERRFFLPEMETNFYIPLDIYKSQKAAESKPQVRHFHSVREAVLTLIYEKTRFLFYSSKGETSYIVPRNLRELRAIIRLLYNMDDYHYDKYQSNDYNKLLFQKYFFETWLINNLDKKGIDIVKNIWNADILVKNKLIVDTFKDKFVIDDRYYVDVNTYGIELTPSLREILTASNKVYDISTGDVMGLLDTLSLHLVTSTEQKLLFAIKSIYSMLLYKYYDMFTASESEKEEGATIFRDELLKNIPEYTKLVAGSFFNSNLYNLLPSSRVGYSRMNKIVNAKIISDELKGLFEQRRKMPDEGTPAYKKIVAKLNVIEFFIINFSGRGRSKKIDTRSIGNPSYIFDITSSTENMKFDAMAWAYNLVDIDNTYSRYSKWFGGVDNDNKSYLLEFVKSIPDSMYNRIKAKAKHRSSYKSMVCFRNSEILSAFVAFVINNRQEGSSDNLKLFVEFYKLLGRFSIKVYDNYEVDFKYIAAMGEGLSEISKEQTPEAWNIFNTVLFTPETLNTAIKINTASNNSTKTILAKIKKNNVGIDIDPLFSELFIHESYKASEVKELLKRLKSIYDQQQIESSDNNG